MRWYYEIAFPLAMPRDTLTYHFDHPDDEPPVSPGCRVVAPIQRRQSIGYVVRAHQQPPDFKTVAIAQIIDRWPLLSSTMVELGLWISQNWFCNPGETFHAMLPSGIKQKITRTIQPTAASIETAGRAPESLPNPVRWLVEQKSSTVTRFLETFPGFVRKMSGFIADGLLEIVHIRTEGAGPKMVRLLGIAPDKPIELAALTPKERQVIEYLLKKNVPCGPATIQKELGISSSPLQQLLRKGYLVELMDRRVRDVATETFYQSEPPPVPQLTDEQQQALTTIAERSKQDHKPFLVRGVTCSGKTEIYLRLVAEQLGAGKSVIVLVPEISLTPQMVKRFRDRFARNVAILHSKLSDGERFDQWEHIRRGECRVVVGARSAVFAPTPNLGMIIIDEEGEPTFKQGESPRYHAREVAAKRCELEHAVLVMGSATPTMDSYQRALDGRYHLIELHKRVTDRRLPEISVVDMRQELTAKKNRSLFSGDLSKALTQTLAENHQAILYLNRRGHSSFVFCRACGEAVICSRCQVSLVFHDTSRILRCHYCGEAREIPTTCPRCASAAIKFFGAGTQRIEAEAKRYFPQARIQRLDSDTVAASGSLEDILERFGRREIDILIGTQMVAKGLDFPHVTLVGIMASDGLLRLPDFRASERNFSLLAQVSGRAGRGESPGRVILQTYFPEHHSIKFALTEDYLGFFHEEVQHRREAGFPPFNQVAIFILSSENKVKAQLAGALLRDRLLTLKNDFPVEILGPAPAPLEKINNQYRFQVLIKFPFEDGFLPTMRQCLEGFNSSGVKITTDIDPYFTL